jgi:hypothetical protein
MSGLKDSQHREVMGARMYQKELFSATELTSC